MLNCLLRSQLNKTQIPCAGVLHVKESSDHICKVSGIKHFVNIIILTHPLGYENHTHTHQKRKALSLIQDCRNAGLIHLKKQNKYILTLLSNLTLSTLQDVFHWGVKDEAHILKKALFGEKTCVSITGAVQATVHYLYLRQVWAGNCNKHFTEACVLPNHIHSPSFPHARGTFRL